VSTESPTTETTPTVRATRYEVSCVPEGNVNARYFTLRVEYRGHGKWVVCEPCQPPLCLGRDGTWDWESRVTDEWIANRRFDLDTALKLAEQAAPLMEANGLTVADVLARQKRGEGQ
jgi:hypothetical protein